MMSQIIKNPSLMRPDRYVMLREKYDYNSPDCTFEIIQTDNMFNVGKFIGIFAREVPSGKPNGVNLRRFENIVQEVFQDCYAAYDSNNLTDIHIENLKQISSAIIYWKMASQGERAQLKMDNLLAKWNVDTVKQLIDAPLGWPANLRQAFYNHKAGRTIDIDSNDLFSLVKTRVVCAGEILCAFTVFLCYPQSSPQKNI